MNMMTVTQSKTPVSGGFRVDVSRGQRVGRVSSEWFTRPDDERFLNLSDLYEAVRGRAERAQARTVENRTLVVTIGAVAVLVGTIVVQPSPIYIWNSSASVPVGLYRVRPAGSHHVTELVAVRPPAPLASYLDLNGYLPTGVPMLKRVLALPGQTVCRNGHTISVDGIEMARRGSATDVADRCRSGKGATSLKTEGSSS